jgi:hypothetical protein
MLAVLLRALRRSGTRAMDPLHVAMTGVRMGERFLQIGCDDRALLAGLASKVGLSGGAAAVVFDERSAALAQKLAARVGALVEVQQCSPGAIAAGGAYDLIVVDDTAGAVANLSAGDRARCFASAHDAARPGGRIEVIERATPPSRTETELACAGFKPVRVLAERDGRRFIEGLKAAPIK